MSYSMEPSDSGPLPSDASTESLDLSRYAYDDMLFSESLTLSSLSSSTSYYSTPPLPAGCMVPLSTIIGPEGPTMFPSAFPCNTSHATLTSPTPPRLRTMLREKLCIEKWVKTLATSESSGHTPWGGVENVEAISWISEGSIYPPDAFKASLAIARRHRTLPPPSISVTAPPNVFHRSANRNALVFEHEIILNSGGNSRRLSLRVPAKTMNPEVVDMMLELQSLNSFFKEGSEEMDQPAAPQPPSLVVSNSHFALPVSLESSGNLSPGIPLALAARRGKKMLPPLSFKQSVHEEDAYPSMPTAFLGSPSSYSPKFEFASDPNRSSMDLQQMVTSLRSQCASIDSTTPLDANLEELALSTAAGKEEDEWAFADGLLDLYTSRPFDPDFVKKPLLPQLVDYAEESLAHAALSSNNQRPRSDLSPPPSTPLPPCPPPQRLSVRSILKSSKSVRFASLPNERPVSIPTPAVIAPRRSLGSLSPPRKQPPPLRPRSHTVRPTVPAPLRSPPAKPAPTLLRSPGQRRATAPAAPGCMSSPATQPIHCATTTGSPPSKAVSAKGRQSLTRVFSGGTTAKENKARSESPHTPTRTRWTLNENVLRRGSVAGTQKSRMPVPLRNILTRFK